MWKYDHHYVYFSPSISTWKQKHLSDISSYWVAWKYYHHCVYYFPIYTNLKTKVSIFDSFALRCGNIIIIMCIFPRLYWPENKSIRWLSHSNLLLRCLISTLTSLFVASCYQGIVFMQPLLTPSPLRNDVKGVWECYNRIIN